MSYRKSKCVPIKEGDSVIFYINTSGFPLMDEVWSHMWNHVNELQPEAAKDFLRIQENKHSLPDADLPQPPYNTLYNKHITCAEKLEKIQNYMNKLQYNHTGLQFFEIKKERPLIGLADQARRIIENPLPIKCLEAVVLSIFLTNEIANSTLEKFTIGFKTSSHGNVHRHVVLGVYCHSNSKFGALGLSRRADLGYKPLQYTTLSELITAYVDPYASYGHKVKRVKIGMPVPRLNRSFECIGWNGVNTTMDNKSEWVKLVEKHSRLIRHYSIQLKYPTSLSLRNLSNLGGSSTSLNSNTATNTGSYLKNHLDKLSNSFSSSFSKKQKKHQHQHQHQQLVGQSDDLDVFDVDTIDSSEFGAAESEEINRFILNDKNMNFMPRTAPMVFNTNTNGTNSGSMFPKIPRKTPENISTASFLVELQKRETTNQKETTTTAKSLRV